MIGPQKLPASQARIAAQHAQAVAEWSETAGPVCKCGLAPNPAHSCPRDDHVKCNCCDYCMQDCALDDGEDLSMDTGGIPFVEIRQPTYAVWCIVCGVRHSLAIASIALEEIHKPCPHCRGPLALRQAATIAGGRSVSDGGS